MKNRPPEAHAMPWPLTLALVAVGLPRTVLADLDIVPPESGLLYYFLALAPFVLWLAVAALRPTPRPLRDFLILGVLYGLSLVLVHQLLWNAPGAAHSVPDSLATSSIAPPFDDIVVRLSTSAIGLGIGVGAGSVAGLVALAAKTVRQRRRPR